MKNEEVNKSLFVVSTNKFKDSIFPPSVPLKAIYELVFYLA